MRRLGRKAPTCETSFTVSRRGVGISVPRWRSAIRSWYPSMVSQNVSYNDLGDLYLDKLNKNHLTRNLVHRLERLGYSVTLTPQQKAA
jgi:hypothetical protein